MTRTKIEVHPALVRRVSGLDDLARILFPDNRNHRRVFIAIWIELKYADGQFVQSFSHLPSSHGFSERMLEIVRAKMKRMGVLKRVSHFSPHHGHTGGWTFSERFAACLVTLATALRTARVPSGRDTDEQKDRDSILYV